MALPTAATPGYGFYPTYGDNPDVACNCAREWLPVFMRLMDLKGLGRIVVWNCVSDLEASGSTHIGGGATDWGGIREDRAMLAREMGATATWPRNWSGNQHTHSVLNGCPHTSQAADYQVSAVILRRDGLGYHGLAGPDPLPLPSTIRTWEQGVAWARAEIARIEKEQIPMAIADDILAEIKALRAEEADRYKVDAARYKDEQGDLGRIEDIATQHRSEDAARYADFLPRFNSILAAIAALPPEADVAPVLSGIDDLKAQAAELKALVDALPKG